MSFFISNAMADAGAAQAGAGGSPVQLIIMLVVFAAIFYFMILRPQQRRSKTHKDLMASIAIGDEVLTNGGLIGRVTKVNENGYLVIELNENNQVVIKRDYVSAVLPKGTLKSL